MSGRILLSSSSYRARNSLSSAFLSSAVSSRGASPKESAVRCGFPDQPRQDRDWQLVGERRTTPVSLRLQPATVKRSPGRRAKKTTGASCGLGPPSGAVVGSWDRRMLPRKEPPPSQSCPNHVPPWHVYQNVRRLSMERIPIDGWFGRRRGESEANFIPGSSAAEESLITVSSTEAMSSSLLRR